MSWGHPWLLALLAVLPFALTMWVVGMRRGRRSGRLISREGQRRPSVVAAVLVVAGAGLAIVAAAQPRWGEEESLIPRQGTQLIFVVDVSRSMSVQDVAPDRMAAARAAMKATLRRLGGDKVGLVIFAGSATLRIPLTTDLAAAEQLIDALEPGPVLVEKGTDASSGVGLALDSFDAEIDSGRLIVLIGDGDDLGADPAGVAARVRESGAGLLVAGTGTTEGGIIPVYDPAKKAVVPKLDADGAPIISRLNEPYLKAMATASGGRYVGGNLAALPGAIEGRLVEMRRARFEQQAATLPVERYQWFAGGALIALVLATLLERLPRPGRRAVLGFVTSLLALFTVACETRAHDLNSRATAAFAAGDLEAAEALLLEARAERPQDARLSLNLAYVLQGLERHDEASRAAQGVLASSRSAEVRAQAYAAIGHSRFASSDLPGALDAFRSALIEDPADGESRHDYEVVLRLMRPPAPPAEPGAQPAEQPGSAGATPTPGAGGESPTPAASQPGAGPPVPVGDGPPEPGAAASTPQELRERIAELDRQIKALQAEAGDEPTIAQTIQILELLGEQQRLANQRPAVAGGDPGDY